MRFFTASLGLLFVAAGMSAPWLATGLTVLLGLPLTVVGGGILGCVVARPKRDIPSPAAKERMQEIAEQVIISPIKRNSLE